MRGLRQAAPAIIIAVVSLLLVVGAVALSLVQGRGPGLIQLPTARPASTAIPSPPSTITPSAESAPSGNVLPTQGSSSATPRALPTSAPSQPSAPTSKAGATAKVPCGPDIGWVKAYEVQRGDTLFRIATLHGITVAMLQKANCKTGTLIYAGEMLWVPFVLPAPTQPTIIPTFPTPTEPATPTATDTATPTETLTQQS